VFSITKLQYVSTYEEKKVDHEEKVLHTRLATT